MKNAFEMIKFNMNEIEAATGIPASIACGRLNNAGISTSGGATFDQIVEHVVDQKITRNRSKKCNPERVALLKMLLKAAGRLTQAGETLKINDEEEQNND